MEFLETLTVMLTEDILVYRGICNNKELRLLGSHALPSQVSYIFLSDKVDL